MKNLCKTYLTSLAAVVLALAMLTTAALAEVWFGEPIASQAPYEINRYAVGDLNNDGVDDIAFTSTGVSPNRLCVMLNDGQGHFDLVWEEPGMAGSLAVAELNGDGFLDLVAATAYDVRVFYGNGRGGFVEGARLDPPMGGAWFIAAGDLDLDGLSEVIVDELGQIAVFWNGPSGLSDTPTEHWYNLYQPYIHCGEIETHRMRVVDATGNGLPDIVLTGGTMDWFCYFDWGMYKTVAILENYGSRNLAQEAVFPIVAPLEDTTYNWRDFDVADLNMDGLPDIGLVRDDDVHLRLFLRQQGGSYIEGEGLSTIIGKTLAFTDLNEDGLQDLIWSRPNVCTEVLLGLGDATFEPVDTIAAGFYGMLLGEYNGLPGVDLAGRYDSTFYVVTNLGGASSSIDVGQTQERPLVQVSPTVMTERECTILAPRLAGHQSQNLAVIDVSGRTVARISGQLIDDQMMQAKWDGRNANGTPVPSGWYWIRPEGDRNWQAGRVLIVR